MFLFVTPLDGGHPDGVDPGYLAEGGLVETETAPDRQQGGRQDGLRVTLSRQFRCEALAEPFVIGPPDAGRVAGAC